MSKILNFSSFDYHLLNDEIPSIYFRKILNLLNEKYPYNILGKLMSIEQNPIYHPEGNVWEHTMQVVDNAAKLSSHSTNKKVFMWSSLLHDIGKGITTKIRNGKITAYNHEIKGAELAKDFLSFLTDNSTFIDKVCKLVKWHMQPLLINKNLPFSKIKDMSLDISISEVGLFSLCDRLGRGNLTNEKIKKEIEFIIQFLNICYREINDIAEKNRINNLKNALTHKSFYIL